MQQGYGGYGGVPSGITGPAQGGWAPPGAGMGAPMGAPPPIAPAGSFEFDASQNKVIEEVGGAMHFVAVLLFLHGGVALLNAVGQGMSHRIPEAIGTAVGGVLYGVMGASLHKAGSYFKQIVTTQGNDIPHLMNALTHLRGAFRLVRTLYLILLGILVVAFVAGIIIAIAMKH